ncbi:MAG: hypothetical protein JSW37_04290, partial [Anaerolineales bacterium]
WNGRDDEPTEPASRSACTVLRIKEPAAPGRSGAAACATGSELFALPTDWGDLLRSELQRQREGHKSRRLWGGIRRGCDPSWRAGLGGRGPADAQRILDRLHDDVARSAEMW